jgi:hypothetical protein
MRFAASAGNQQQKAAFHGLPKFPVKQGIFRIYQGILLQRHSRTLSAFGNKSTMPTTRINKTGT